MSFLTKLCSSVFKNCERALINHGNSIFNSVPQSRNFHMIMRPIAAVSSSPVTLNTGIKNALQVTSGCRNGLERFLQPYNSLLTQVAGFKVKGRLRRRCKDCYFVIRQQRHYVICPTHPRHKQMSMKKRDYKSWILTHATQSKQRPY